MKKTIIIIVISISALIAQFIILIALFIISPYFHYYFPPKEPPEEYRDYLSYSLGEYKVINVRRLHTGPDRSVFGHWAIEWQLQYLNQYDEQMIFSIRKGDFHDNLVGYVFYNATSDAASRMNREIISKYFPVIDRHAVTSPGDRITGAYLSWADDERGYRQNIDRYAYAVEPITGLRLSTVTPQELVVDWDCVFNVIIRTGSCEYDFNKLFNGLEPMIRDLYIYSSQEEFEILINCGRGTCHYYKGYYNYCSQTDTFENNLTIRKNKVDSV